MHDLWREFVFEFILYVVLVSCVFYKFLIEEKYHELAMIGAFYYNLIIFWIQSIRAVVHMFGKTPTVVKDDNGKPKKANTGNLEEGLKALAVQVVIGLAGWTILQIPVK